MNNPIPMRALPLTGHPVGEQVAGRLLEFSWDTAPWQRRLWDVGTVLGLREIYEAGPWVEAQVLSPAAMQWLCHRMERLAGDDRGVGAAETRRQLRDALRADLVGHSRHRRRLTELTDLIEDSYLRRWAVSVDSPEGVSAERLASAVSTHLLDRGFSPESLHRVVRMLMTNGATIGDLLDETAQLAGISSRQFEVMVPFTAIPQQQQLAETLPEWRSGPQVRSWLARWNTSEPFEHIGGFLYTVQAMDPYSAGRRAGELVDRLLSRSSFVRRKRSGLKPVGLVWVDGLDEPLPLASTARGVNVMSLQKEAILYRVRERGLLDEALDLAAPLNKGAPGSAVAGGWAALESLLFHPGDDADRREGRVVAAARMAAIVACSWPRAELTTLSYAHRPDGKDLLGQRLANTGSKRDRALAVAATLQADRGLATKSATDDAAVCRMAALATTPRKQLQSVRETIEGTFRRLYRLRNIVLHGGATQPTALNAVLRTAAPLVGAGLDRIAHAYLVCEIEPLALAARAELRLALAGTPDAPGITDLLE